MAPKASNRARDRLVALLSRFLDRGARQTPPKEFDPSTVKRILVVKPCCFGDVMMATPALRALHHGFPGASIDVLTTAWCAEALRNNPDVHRVYRYPAKVSIAPFMRLVQRAKAGRYDIGVSLDRSPVVSLFLSLASIPVRAGIDSSGRGIGLTHRVNPKPGQHETELYLDVVGSIGIECQGTNPVYCVQADARAEAAILLDGLADPVVVIHPGGAVNPGSTLLSKRWPAVMFGELASELVERLGASIVVVGADSDADSVQVTIDFTDASVTNLVSRLSVPVLAAVCERAALYIGNDSGMSHLASAVGTPTVTIFGPTSPETYRPLGPNAAVCRPAGHSVTPASHDLRRKSSRPGEGSSIGEVTVDAVLTACERVLTVTHGANLP